jgi:hypothetical protein
VNRPRIDAQAFLAMAPLDYECVMAHHLPRTEICTVHRTGYRRSADALRYGAAPVIGSVGWIIR